MLILRILSAIIGIPIVLGVVYLGGPWFAIFVLFVALLATYEYNKLVNRQILQGTTVLVYLGVTLLIAIIYCKQFVLLYHFIMLLFFVLGIYILFNAEKKSTQEAALSLWGIIYIGGLLGYMILLREMADGMLYMYLLLGGVWIHDTLAYFVGVRWGSHRIAPAISPKKSVEGSLAGIGGALVIFFSVSIFAPDLIKVNPGGALILSLGISIFGQLGDLLESALKRQIGVKDSGALIPGHGGVLDRFDSMMLAAPFVYYFFVLVDLLQ